MPALQENGQAAVPAAEGANAAVGTLAQHGEQGRLLGLSSSQSRRREAHGGSRALLPCEAIAGAADHCLGRPPIAHRDKDTRAASAMLSGAGTGLRRRPFRLSRDADAGCIPRRCVPPLHPPTRCPSIYNSAKRPGKM